MLVVSEVLPGSPADGKLAAGRHPGARQRRAASPTSCRSRTILDDTVGGTVEIEVERGGEPLAAALPVQDLHAITPAEYLEFGDAVVHTLSLPDGAPLQRARARRVRRQSRATRSSAAGVPRGAVSSQCRRQAGRRRSTTSSRSLAGAAATARARRCATSRSTTRRAPRRAVMRMDRRWFPARRCQRDDATGLWPCADAAAGAGRGAGRRRLDALRRTGDDARRRSSRRSLVLVNFDMPFSVSGVTERNYHGTGRRSSTPSAAGRRRPQHRAGVDRATCASPSAARSRCRARSSTCTRCTTSRWSRTTRRLLGGTPVRAAKFDTRELEPGEAVTVVGLGGDSRVRSLGDHGRDGRRRALPAVAHAAVPRHQPRGGRRS